MHIVFSVALLAVLAACGSPTSESRRPHADEGICDRIDGQTRCSGNISSAKSPSEKSSF